MSFGSVTPKSVNRLARTGCIRWGSRGVEERADRTQGRGPPRKAGKPPGLLGDGEEGDDAQTFGESHADDAHRQNVAESAGIAAHGFCSLRADETHAKSGAKTGETGDDTAPQ